MSNIRAIIAGAVFLQDFARLRYMAYMNTCMGVIRYFYPGGE
jgi:hypothetical protein